MGLKDIIRDGRLRLLRIIWKLKDTCVNTSAHELLILINDGIKWLQSMMELILSTGDRDETFSSSSASHLCSAVPFKKPQTQVEPFKVISVAPGRAIRHLHPANQHLAVGQGKDRAWSTIKRVSITYLVKHLLK